jgi:hypothetical protein
MEPEVHIIEKYFQERLGYFTMTNIRCKGGKEIDLLAIDPVSGIKYHVESRISTVSPLCITATKTKGGKLQKNGLDYFAKEKFNHPYVIEKIQDYFGTAHYVKMLVVYSIKNGKTSEERKAFIVEAGEKFGINVSFIGKMIESLSKHGETMGSRDDVLRLIELITAEERIGRIKSIRNFEKNNPF